MSALTYMPTEPPRRPFRKGDRVDVLDRDGEPMSRTVIRRVLKTRVVTGDGRRWDLKGWWMDEEEWAYPFPSIRIAEAN